MSSNADYLCSILGKNSASSNEMKIEGIIYALSILAEVAVEKLPAILNEQINYLQSQLNDINAKMSGMQNYNQQSFAPSGMLPPPPGLMNSPGMHPPPMGNYAPKPAPKPSEPMNMQDEIKRAIAKRRYD